MNKHKMIWGVLVASLLGLFLGGCSKELGRGGNEEVPGLPEKGQAVTFTVTTGVETYAVPAQDYEKSISTLQALLFDASGRYVTSGTPAPTASGATSYTLPIATTGTYKMLLVANYTIPVGSLTGKSLSDVRAILVDNEPGMPNAFVMASTTIPDFTVTTGAMSDAGTINLERLAARIDVQSTLDKLTLSKITVKNRKTQSSLLAASSTNAYKTDGKEYGAFERFRKPATDASMGQIYAYENSAASAAGSADGTSLVIETAYNGTAVKPLEVKLPQMKRNYIYSIQLKMGDEGYVPDPSDNPDPSKIKLSFNLRVLDWNTGETFVVSEEDLLKIFKKGAVSYSYGLTCTTDPNIASGVGAQGGTVSVIATATKQKLVGGTPDPTAPVETINGADKFDYSILATPSVPDWLTVSPAGVLTIRENNTFVARTATVQVVLRENPAKSTFLSVMQVAATPITTHAYALTSVSPESLTFEAAGSSQTLSIVGTDTEMQNGTPTKTTPLTIADVTITKSAGADWLTVSGATVTAAENTTTAARQATLTITVTADPTQTKTVAVSQKVGMATAEYSITSVTPSAISFNGKGGSQTISIAGTVVNKMNGKEVGRRSLSLSDITIDKTAGAEWLTIRDGVISAAANKSGVVRQATLTIKVKEDAATSKTLTVTQRVAYDNNPLAYVAHFNIMSNGQWDTNHTVPSRKEDHNLLMSWSIVMNMFGIARSVQGSTETYKLPSLEAWRGISAHPTYLLFGSGGVQYNQTAQVEVAGQKFNSTGDYKPTTMIVNGSSVKCIVALRFKGDDPTEKQYRSAWLYYWDTHVVNDQFLTGLWIYCVNISGRQDISTVDHLDQAFWDQNLSSAVVRFFPPAGIDEQSGDQGISGHYWSATEEDRMDAYNMIFDSGSFRMDNSYRKYCGMSVRLFSSEPLD